MASSSNVYFAKAIWERYGITGKKQEYSDFLHEKLRLGQTVGLERLGERAPVDHHRLESSRSGRVMLVKMSYGYRVRLAPIQMITFYNAIANGGKMISPVLVRELQRGDRVEERFESRTSPRRSAALGAARGAAVTRTGLHRGYRQPLFQGHRLRLRVAAKTGIGADHRRPQPRRPLLPRLDDRLLPGRQPRYTVLTTIETRAQAGKAYYGGPLAGPVVKRMVDYIYNRNRDWYARRAARSAPPPPTGSKGGDIAQIRRVADKLCPAFVRPPHGLGPRAGGQPSNVVITSLPAETGTMPDVRGMGLKDALFYSKAAA